MHYSNRKLREFLEKQVAYMFVLIIKNTPIPKYLKAGRILNKELILKKLVTYS